MRSTIHLLLITVGIILSFTRCTRIEPVDPIDLKDQAFFQALLELGIDTNGDGMISKTEAASVRSLDVSGKGIYDISGIESFVNLRSLNCCCNYFTTLDLIHNTSLDTLRCFMSALTQLEVSENASLRYLDCSSCDLTSLDLTNTTALEYLNCFNCGLTSLDVSNQPVLERLLCGGNQLTALDISNNTSLVPTVVLYDCYLGIENMPTLEQVCVWTIPFPPDNLTVCADGSPNVYFTTGCSR